MSRLLDGLVISTAVWQPKELPKVLKIASAQTKKKDKEAEIKRIIEKAERIRRLPGSGSIVSQQSEEDG